ncbi:MAG: hypothetical protein ACI3VU_03610 [Faecousia sp.]
MITIRETTENDLPDIQRLWADGDAMKFFSFPETCSKRIFSKKTLAEKPPRFYFGLRYYSSVEKCLMVRTI